MTKMQTNIQQRRAAFALSQVQAVAEKCSPEVQKRFKAYSNSFPAMMQMNGIGQALAFAYQKSNGETDENRGWQLIFQVCQRWLLEHSTIWQSRSEPLMNVLTTGSQEQYQLAQAEVQALFSWVKDFARAEIKGDVSPGE